MRVDYIRVAGREWVRSPDERFDSLDILGPLMLAIPRAMSAVLDDIPKSFRLPGNTNQREDVPLIPQTALREAVVNALMHRSYPHHQPVQIIRYSNRVEIRNPGVSLVPDELLGEPGSRQRNPRIAAVLHDAGFAETKGSGIRAIREAMARAGLSPPTFESDRERDTFVVTFLFHHFLSGEDIEWLGRFRRLALTEAEQRALVFVREVGAINIAAYRDLNRVETSVAAAELRRLKDAGLLDLHRKGAAMHYRPTELLMAPAGSAASENKSLFALGGAQPTELTPNLHGLPTEPAPNLHGLPTELAPNLHGLPTELAPNLHGLPTELAPNLHGLPTELAPNLHGLPTELDTAVRSLGQRATNEQIRVVIERLCRWRPQTSDQLAKLLGRNKHHLVTSILRRMVKDGRLSLTHPEAPAHPQQAYTARPPGP
jgi:ATP-dependent DNA helicase RecG